MTRKRSRPVRRGGVGKVLRDLSNSLAFYSTARPVRRGLRPPRPADSTRNGRENRAVRPDGTTPRNGGDEDMPCAPWRARPLRCEAGGNPAGGARAKAATAIRVDVPVTRPRNPAGVGSTRPGDRGVRPRDRGRGSPEGKRRPRTAQPREARKGLASEARRRREAGPRRGRTGLVGEPLPLSGPRNRTPTSACGDRGPPGGGRMPCGPGEYHPLAT
jgi:hypothetical protein